VSKSLPPDADFGLSYEEAGKILGCHWTTVRDEARRKGTALKVYRMGRLHRVLYSSIIDLQRLSLIPPAGQAQAQTPARRNRIAQARQDKAVTRLRSLGLRF
jgi:hypothetical protein